MRYFRAKNLWKSRRSPWLCDADAGKKNFRPAEKTMQDLDELCLCFHVSKRKVANFIRVERPSRPGQLSECFGAGTGCGWCRPYLRLLFDEAVARGETRPDPYASTEEKAAAIADLSPAEYARLRSAYVRSGGGTPPPGATPIEEE